MNATVLSYGIYLVIALPLTKWVARNLFQNGRIFLVDCFHGKESLADNVNHLLVFGSMHFFQPLVKKAVHLLSENRLAISRLFRIRGDWQLASALDSVPSQACEGDNCKI